MSFISFSKKAIGKLRSLPNYGKKIANLHNMQIELERAFLLGNRFGIRAFSTKKIMFVSTKQLLFWTHQMCMRLPKDFDLVVAIPTTGLLVGSYVALNLGLPLSTPEMLKKGLMWQRHNPHPEKSAVKIPDDIKKIVLVDDGSGIGKTLQTCYDLIKTQYPQLDIFVARAWQTGIKHHLIDLSITKAPYIKTILNEWTLTSSAYRNMRIASDIDGVIFNDFIKKPMFIPHYKLLAIISDRLETERCKTESWLEKNKVAYEKLFLAKSPEERRNDAHKIFWLKKIKPDFYIESDQKIADHLWVETGVPILCYKTMTMNS